MRMKAVPINISGRTIGDGYPCFVTYEAGPTDSGIEWAKRLVKLAAEAGADVIALCDTNGGMLPDELSQVVELVNDKPTEREQPA